MDITRRGFLKLTGTFGAASALGLNFRPAQAYAAELNKMNRLKMAKQYTTVCAYCSVGCGLICSVGTDRPTRDVKQPRCLLSLPLARPALWR